MDGPSSVSRSPGGALPSASRAWLSGALAAALACMLLPGGAAAPLDAPAQQPGVDPGLFDDMSYRMVGPYRGGRATAGAGHPDRPNTFYMGATGGGVWRTTNAGVSWENLSDGSFGGSIGAIAVAPSNPQVMYVGEGSSAIRGNVSRGRGMHRSVDGGRTWQHVGLGEAGQIGRVVVHPRDPQVVYAAALGNPFAKNETRGVFKSTDGGESWEHVLFINDSTGVVDLAMNPERPGELFAGAWSAERKPWDLRDGTTWNGGGGLYRTTDGGETWEHLQQGLPSGDELVGKVGVDVSPADPDRVFVNMHARRPDHALYRSDDGGDTWTKVSTNPDVLDRPFYYTYVRAHPTDPNTVYVPDESLWVSHDGGSSWEEIPVPHGDLHGLWIDSDRPNRMLVNNDGGAQVSVDGGESWTTYYNQPTAQFYRVEVDERWPYNLYGAQQDNSTMRVPSRRLEGLSRESHWTPVGGGESGHVAIQSYGPDIAWAGSYAGLITRKNLRTKLARNRQAYPQHMLGMAPKRMKYRFQWNAPIEVNPHDSTEVFHAAQKLLRTRDGGRSWTEVSADLTHDDTTKQEAAGGPVLLDATGVEVYNTIFALTPSTHEEGVIWAGTDDGRVWITRQGAGVGNWAEVTPGGLPQWSTVNSIEVSPHDPASAYVTAYRYRLGDFTPYVFRTEDYGASWTRIADGSRGIPADHPTRAVREDPEQEGLLYAGTEYGIYVSFDDGGQWQPFHLDAEGKENGVLPRVPVTDLEVHRGDLVVATQGRAFWILDELGPVRQAAAGEPGGPAHLYRPSAAHRWAPGGLDRGTPSDELPEGPPEGAVLDYWLSEEAGEPVRLEVLSPDGELVRSFTTGEGGSGDLPDAPGHHRVSWDLTYPGVELPDGVVLPRNHTGGFRAPPGTYSVRLTVGSRTTERELEVRIPPPYREEVSAEDLHRLADFSRQVRDTLQSVYDRLATLADVREQVEAVRGRLEGSGAGERLVPAADSLAARLRALEAELHQQEIQARDDPFQYPPEFDGQVAALYGSVADAEDAPTDGVRQRWQDLLPEWEQLRSRVEAVLDSGVQEFNERLEEAGVQPVIVGRHGVDSQQQTGSSQQ